MNWSSTNSAPSSWFVPSMMGTWLYVPERSASTTGSVRTLPSTMGRKVRPVPENRLARLPVELLINVLAETERMQETTAEVEPVQPSLAAKSAPVCSAVESGEVSKAETPSQGPLSVIAFWKRPAASGEAIWSQTLEPPADSPKMVTLFALPPKLVIFAL